MAAHLLTGSKEQIASQFAKLDSEVRQAIVFVDDSAQPPVSSQDVLAEMESYIVCELNADDSREAIYRRADGE